MLTGTHLTSMTDALARTNTAPLTQPCMFITLILSVRNLRVILSIHNVSARPKVFPGTGMMATSLCLGVTKLLTAGAEQFLIC